jgi:enoyl-CoA hydratase
LSQRLPRLIGINRAKELSLTVNFLDAETAEAWGLVNRVVAPADLLPTCQQLASDITTTESVTRAEIKRIMDAGWESTLEQGLLIENKASRAHASSTPAKEMLSDRRSDIQQRGREQTG